MKKKINETLYEFTERKLSKMANHKFEKLEYPAYGNYRPSREVLLLAIEVAYLERNL